MRKNQNAKTRLWCKSNCEDDQRTVGLVYTLLIPPFIDLLMYYLYNYFIVYLVAFFVLFLLLHLGRDFLFMEFRAPVVMFILYLESYCWEKTKQKHKNKTLVGTNLKHK